MRHVELKVRLTFSESVESDEDLQEIVDNVFGALKHECNAGNGIAPESAEYYTEEIQVSCIHESKISMMEVL